MNLFGGKRQRGTRLPPAPEFNTHCMLADMLRRWAMPQWRWTHLPFGEKRLAATAARLKRMGVNAGWPDFIFVGPPEIDANGVTHDIGMAWLELKRKGEKQSEQQRHIMQHLKANGHRTLCTSSLDEAVAWLKELGILRAEISL